MVKKSAEKSAEVSEIDFTQKNNWKKNDFHDSVFIYLFFFQFPAVGMTQVSRGP